MRRRHLSIDAHKQSGNASIASESRNTPHASPASALSPLVSYFAPLQKRFAKTARNTLYEAISGLLFLDSVEYKNIAVWLAAFHYLPILAMLMTVTVTCLLHVLMSFVYPLLTDGSYHTVLHLVAHSGVFLGVCVLGYKLMCVVLDGLVDSCLYVEEPLTKSPVPFYQLLHDLRSILQSNWSSWVLVFCILVVPVTAWEILLRDVLSMRWNRGDATMFHWCTFLFLVSAGWLLTSFARLVRKQRWSPTANDVVQWWAVMIPRVRRRCAYGIVLCALYMFLVGGGSEGMLNFSEGMIYLATPHLLASLAVRLALFERNLRYFVVEQFTVFHLKGTRVLVPYILLLGLSYFYFGPKPVFWLQVPPLLLMMVTVKRICSNGPTGVQSVWRMSMSLYFCNTKQLQRTLPHFKAGILVRFGLRVLLSLALALVISLGMWVALQQYGLFMGDVPTSCKALSDRHLLVRTSFMEANLFSLPPGQPVSPEELVFEEQSFLYDRNRYSALCSRVWYDVLHAADLGYFSLMAYLGADSDDFRDSFDFYQRHRAGAANWTFVRRTAALAHGAVFHHFRLAESNLSVIAVRGTALGAPHDFLQNLLVFGETAIFQLFAAVVPLGGFLSDRVKSDFFAFSSKISAALFGEDVDIPHSGSSYFHLQVESYVEQNIPPGERLVLTGHSLGGVISQIVAARKRIPALAFSSPGIGLMYKKYGVEAHSIDAYTSNVVASSDVIPMIDRLSGTVHHMQCEHTRAQICHSIELHTIRMWSMCPSYRALTSVNGSYVITPQLHEVIVNDLWSVLSVAWHQICDGSFFLCHIIRRLLLS
ncbi:transmembrane protein, putative [Bodo saltans]|uniref:Transmembrane protein, putative n=1 Tax=Bodo saltans TaxID=75058 RepID=A0A0S4J9W8_BODSA|nr:transmembrane protein, putative [Bodo saltans]|eukprot:CUG85468.1 transmembrane protein, putative [Bodo saltans]